MAALATVLMLVGYFPYLTYAVPCIASLAIMAVVIELNKKSAFLTYLASLLPIFLFCEMESKLLYICLVGFYPILKALFENTAQLPSVNIEAPTSVIGTNTVDCMKSGLVFGAASMIDGLIERMEKEQGKMATIVATGGLSKEIIRHCKYDIIYDENLLLDGLLTIYKKNI